jgi:hypothetical protein
MCLRGAFLLDIWADGKTCHTLAGLWNGSFYANAIFSVRAVSQNVDLLVDSSDNFDSFRKEWARVEDIPTPGAPFNGESPNQLLARFRELIAKYKRLRKALRSQQTRNDRKDSETAFLVLHYRVVDAVNASSLVFKMLNYQTMVDDLRNVVTHLDYEQTRSL